MLGAWFTSVGTRTVQVNGDYSSLPLVSVFCVASDVQRKGEKGGREGTRTPDLTDVNRYNGNYVRNVNLLEVESFNKWRLC